jgi:hypothetical protein
MSDSSEEDITLTVIRTSDGTRKEVSAAFSNVVRAPPKFTYLAYE